MNISICNLKQTTRYYIMNDNGGNVAYFDSLAKAGLVMRYLQGADMPPDDCTRAVAIMREFDKDAAARAAEREAKRAKRRERALAAKERQAPAQDVATQPTDEDVFTTLTDEEFDALLKQMPPCNDAKED